MKTKKLSMVDIAAMAEVSIATVSRVINGSGGYSKSTEQKVTNIIEKFEYTPNANAKSLRTNISKSIGVVVPDLTNEFFAKIVRVLNNFFLKHKYSVLICDSNEDESLEDMHIAELVEKNVDGIIYISGQADVKVIDKRHAIPVVYIDRRPKHADILIQSDNKQGGYLATKELIDKGCKRILFLRDSRSVSPVRHRRSGYLEALEENQLEFKEYFEVRISPDYVSAKTKISKMLEEGCFFDGVFATNDMMALGCIHALEEKGFKIPQDVKVVGFDDISISEFCNPSITTITQDTEKLGTLAAQALLKLICKEKIIRKETIVPVALHIRKST